VTFVDLLTKWMQHSQDAHWFPLSFLFDLSALGQARSQSVNPADNLPLSIGLIAAVCRLSALAEAWPF